MSEVLRYLIQKTPIGTMMKPNPEGNWISAEDFDRVTAERDDAQACLELSIGREDALKALLTAADERADVLEGLLRLLAELPGVRTSGMWERVVAALKPAEGGGDDWNDRIEKLGSAFLE